MVSLASSCVLIELDTTSPQIAVYAPRYTTADVVNEITVQSNEALSEYQDIYAIDSVGVRHDYTFQRVADDQFVGLIRFNDYPLGLTTIYARLKDDVDNFSETVSATLLVKESTPSLKLDISDVQRSITGNARIRFHTANETVRATRENVNVKRRITINERKRKVDIRE